MQCVEMLYPERSSGMKPLCVRGYRNTILLMLISAAIFMTGTLGDASAQQSPPGQVLSAQELAKRSDALDRREKDLNAMEADLNARLAKLKDLESSLKTMLDEAKALKQERMVKLIAVYTNMKAQQAATLMETVDENLAVQVLAGMKSRQAGEILNKMTPKKGAALSEGLIKFQLGKDLPNKP